MLEPSGFKETLLAKTCHLNTICNQTLEPVKPSKITQVLVWLTAKSKEFDFEIANLYNKNFYAVPNCNANTIHCKCNNYSTVT